MRAPTWGKVGKSLMGNGVLTLGADKGDLIPLFHKTRGAERSGIVSGLFKVS